MSTPQKHSSPATVLAAIALFLSMAGGAYALGRNSVGSKQLKRNAVTSTKIRAGAVNAAKLSARAVGTTKIRNRAVTTAKLRDGAVTTRRIGDGAVTGRKINLDTLGPVPAVRGHETRSVTRVVATDGADFDAARTAAAEVPMFTVGPVALYAKCFTDLSVPRTYAYYFIRTGEDGVIFDSDQDDASGNPFLDQATPEVDRELMYDYAGQDSASSYLMHSDETVAILPDGRAFESRMSLAVKNGILAGGNGMYGEGDACLFTGDLTEYR